MAVGNWVPQLIQMAGGRSLFGKAGEHSPWLEYEELVAADPDVIILSLCGFDIERTRQDLALLEARANWRELRAVREDRVFLADGNQFFNRPGPRLVESLEILAEILHPDKFSFGHETSGWVRA
jgi:iron complex transport system substrate-binding protein